MEQGRNQQPPPQLQPKLAVLAAAGEMKAPAVPPQQPKPAAPAMPVSRQWPMAFDPSPLANTIQLGEVNDLVTQLVTACRMAAATIADNKVNGTTSDKEFHVNGGLSNGNCKQQELKEASQMDILRTGCSDQANISEMDSHWLDNAKDSRPASPTTQALMCDEQETTFGNDYRCSFPSVSCDQDISEINAAQENLVLTGLREYLRVIITRGKINEHKSSSEAADESDGRQRYSGAHVAELKSSSEAVKESDGQQRYNGEHKSSSEAAMESDSQQHQGAMPAVAPRVGESIRSPNGTETPRINQEPAQNDGSKRQ